MKLNVKMKSLGEKVKEPTSYPEPAMKVTRANFPSLSFNSDQIKGVADLGLDEKVTIVLEGKVTSLRKPERWDEKGDNCVYVDFKLLKGSIQPKVRDLKTSDAALAAAKEEVEND